MSCSIYLDGFHIMSRLLSTSYYQRLTNMYASVKLFNILNSISVYIFIKPIMDCILPSIRGILVSSHSVPVNMILFENWVLGDVTKLRVWINPKYNDWCLLYKRKNRELDTETLTEGTWPFEDRGRKW